MKVQPYVSSEDGRLFDVFINANEISFSIIELASQPHSGKARSVPALIARL